MHTGFQTRLYTGLCYIFILYARYGEWCNLGKSLHDFRGEGSYFCTRGNSVLKYGNIGGEPSSPIPHIGHGILHLDQHWHSATMWLKHNSQYTGLGGGYMQEEKTERIQFREYLKFIFITFLRLLLVKTVEQHSVFFCIRLFLYCIA